MILRLIIAILFLPSLAFAGQGMGPGPGFKTYGSADYCTGKLGSYSLYYDADHPVSTTTACKTGGTSTATLTDVTADSGWNTTSGGTYGILWGGALDDFVSLPVADTGISSTNGRIEVKLRTGGTLPANTVGIFEYGDNTTNAAITVRLQYNATGYSGGPGYRLIAQHIDGSTVFGTTAYVSATINTTYTIIADWNSTSVYASIDGQTNTGTGTCSSFTPSTSPTDPKFGERFSSNASPQSVGFDDIKMGASQR